MKIALSRIAKEAKTFRREPDRLLEWLNEYEIVLPDAIRSAFEADQDPTIVETWARETMRAERDDLREHASTALYDAWTEATREMVTHGDVEEATIERIALAAHAPSIVCVYDEQAQGPRDSYLFRFERSRLAALLRAVTQRTFERQWTIDARGITVSWCAWAHEGATGWKGRTAHVRLGGHSSTQPSRFASLIMDSTKVKAA